MLDIGFWSPLPPQRSGIADYSYNLLGELAKTHRVTAIVGDKCISVVPGRERRRLRVPEGVELVSHAELRGRRFDCNVYQMGNNSTFHSYMHESILNDPGLLVLHDPSLFDFYLGLCGGESSPAFLEEMRHDLRDPRPAVPMTTIGGHRDIDRLAILMSRRLVDASAVTVVHSEWAVETLARRSPGSIVTKIHQPATVLERPGSAPATITFGILGGINKHKRIHQALDAFAAVHREFENARIILAGRVDMPELAESIVNSISQLSLTPVVDLRFDVGADEFDRILLECDVLVALRWPTAGETSAPMMRAFGAAMPVITSDVPQFREFDERYCWRVPLDPSAERLELIKNMRQAMRNPEAVRAAGRMAQQFVKSNATAVNAASQYESAIASCAKVRRSLIKRQTSAAVPAVNAIGHWSATTGIGEAARRAVLAMSRAGVSVALTDYSIDVPTDVNRIPTGFVALPKGRSASIDISFLNINELDGVRDEFLRPELGRRLVAYWYWELPNLPTRLVPEVLRFDEIWVASHFVQGNFARYASCPIVVMPSVVAPEADPRLSRRDFGLSETSCVFLFNFDASSGFARKNPFAIIEAFGRTFTRREAGVEACLVMKTMNLDRWPEANYELRRRLDRVGGIVIDEQLTDKEVASLTRCSDVYVSLHRSEGFGLGMAEAMFFGVPVIATRYSGSEEFLTATNSCGVGYCMKAVEIGELRFNPGAEVVYEPGMIWADPYVDQAASWMRSLYEDRRMRHRIGSAGAETIHRRYSMEVAGLAMRKRVEALLSDQREMLPTSQDAA